MPAVDPVILQLRADVAKYRNELKVTTTLVDNSLARQERAVHRLEATVEGSFGVMGRTVSKFTNLLTSVASIGAARGLLAIADTAKSIDAQLSLATASFGTFNQAQEDSRRIASDTRSALEGTATLYGSFIRTAQELGYAQNDASRATETFSKALKVGGAGTQQVQSATLQMGQALASANVQWEELGQILEASPRLAKVFTDSLGVTRAELKKMAEDGKLSGRQLFDALNRPGITQQIDAEFKTLPVTFGDAMQTVENAAIITFGAFDRGGEFSTALANFITDGSGGFETLGDKAERFGADTRAVIEGLANVFDPLEASGTAVFDALGIKIYSVSEQIKSLLGSIDNVRNFYADADNFGTRIENRIKRGLNRAIDRAGGGRHFEESPLIARVDSAGDFSRGERRSQARSRLDRAVRRLEGQGFVVPRREDGTVDEAGVRRKPPAPKPPTTSTTTNDSKKTKGSSAETLAKRAEAERQRELRNDEAFASEKSALNRDLIAARRAITTAEETIAEYDRQEIEAQRKRQNESYLADVAQKRLTEARAKELIALNDKVAAERTAAVNLREQERKRREAVDIAAGDMQNQRDLAQAQAALVDTADERRKAELRLLDLEYEMERAQQEAIIASRDSTEAQKEIARRRLAMLDDLKAADTEAVNRNNEGPLVRYRRGMNDPKTQVEQAVADKLQAVNDGITDAISKKLGVKDPFLRQLLAIFIQQRIMKPLYDALGKGGGLGGILSSIGSAIGIGGGGGIPGFASGGSMLLGGRGGTDRNTLSLNGRPIARVSRGEAMTISPNARAASPRGMTVHQTINVDGRNSVTPARFAQDILDQAAQQAAAAGRVAYSSSMRDAPAAVAKAQRFGR